VTPTRAFVASDAPWSADELVERLRAQGTRYHNLHPFHVRMDAGELSREDLRRWVANRFYYQRCSSSRESSPASMRTWNGCRLW
jgi:pyrroloquinoline quinone (PQQ) biosynthesis protein C